MFVVMHLFAGCRREGDLEDWLARLAEEAGLKLLILSIDLADDPVWDLSEPETFMRLRELVAESLIAAVFGGPPGAMWSRLRFRARGLRPLRFRGALWGRADVRPAETARLPTGSGSNVEGFDD